MSNIDVQENRNDEICQDFVYNDQQTNKIPRKLNQENDQLEFEENQNKL